MSSSANPASATAARQASTVSDSGSTIRRRPERGPPDPGQHGSGARTVRVDAAAGGASAAPATATGSIGVDLRPSARTGAATRPLHGSNRTVTSWPMCTSVGFTARRCWSSGERSGPRRGRRWRSRRADRSRATTVRVDGVTDDGAPTGDPTAAPRPAPAGGADRHGRMHERATVRAALNAETPVGTRGPEPLGGRRQLRQGPHRPARSPSLAMICGRSTVVRIPGSAAQTTGTALTARFAV